MGRCSNNRMSIPVALGWLYLRLWHCFSISFRFSWSRTSGGEYTRGEGALYLELFWMLRCCGNPQTWRDQGEQTRRRDLWACIRTRKVGCGKGLYLWDHISDQQGRTTTDQRLSIDCSGDTKIELTWQVTGEIWAFGRVFKFVTAWYHSSGDVFTEEKKQGLGIMGRWVRVRGA